MGIRTIPCIFGKEKNQEALMCFLCLEERRKAKNSSKQRAGPRESLLLLFLVGGVLEAFYSPGTLFEATDFVGPPFSNGLDQVELGQSCQKSPRSLGLI